MDEESQKMIVRLKTRLVLRNLMNPFQHGLRLKSGRKVEEIIHESAKELDKEPHLHSFIINDTEMPNHYFQRKNGRKFLYRCLKRRR